MKESMVQILRPDFEPLVKGRKVYPVLSDYVTVPRLSLYGTEKFGKILSNKALTSLFILQKELENGKAYSSSSSKPRNRLSNSRAR